MHERLNQDIVIVIYFIMIWRWSYSEDLGQVFIIVTTLYQSRVDTGYTRQHESTSSHWTKSCTPAYAYLRNLLSNFEFIFMQPLVVQKMINRFIQSLINNRYRVINIKVNDPSKSIRSFAEIYDLENIRFWFSKQKNWN